MLTDFVGIIKQQIFNYLWKIKQTTLIIDHFIIKYKLHGMVIRRSRRSVPWRSTTSLFFDVTFYTLILFWLGTQKSNTNFNYIIYTIKLDLINCWVKLTMFYKKGEFTYNVSITLKEFNFPYIHASSPKTLTHNERND